MAFFKFRWPGASAPDGSSKPAARARIAPVESIDAIRRRARHRLIGAVTLVALAVLGFPLLFDSQPRPIPMNVAVEIPDRNQVAPLVLAQQTPPPAQAAPMAADDGLDSGEELLPSGPGTAAKPAKADKAESAANADKPAPAADKKPEAKPQPKPEAKPEPKAEPKPAPKPEPKPEVKPEVKPPPKPSLPPPPPKPEPLIRPDDAARARALLEGRDVVVAKAGSPESARFIVQAGAYADPEKAREVRDKLERAGLKTYTQVVDTREGKRTRVRLGPFASRAEADRAAERAKSIGVPGAVLTL